MQVQMKSLNFCIMFLNISVIGIKLWLKSYIQLPTTEISIGVRIHILITFKKFELKVYSNLRNKINVYFLRMGNTTVEPLCQYRCAGAGISCFL